MLRTFTDQEGNEWQAFDVTPRDDERRRYDRRASGEIRAEDVERREDERRLTVGRGSTVLHRGEGWLCFEQGLNRRRLVPIPEGWETCADAALLDYCKAAKPVKLVNFTRK